MTDQPLSRHFTPHGPAMNLDLITKELTRDEGLRLKPYRDSKGLLTIGIGRNLDDVGISEGEADLLLANDLAVTMADLDAAIPWWRGLNEVRQRVVVNMAFNCGTSRGEPKFWTFKNMLRHLEAGRYDEAAAHMEASKWAQDVGARATRLVEMMRTGAEPT